MVCVGVLALGLCSAGCPSTSAADAGPVASAPRDVEVAPDPALDSPPREGCARTGELDGLENDATCIVPKADEALTRESMKEVAIELTPDRPSIVAGSTMLMRLAIVNRGKTEASMVFVAQPAAATARPDWTRLAGVPELRPGSPDSPRILLFMRTLDKGDRSVDGLPTTPQATGASAKLLLVRLRAGARLTHALPWWALRIPPPMPIFYDDAGHRFVPKTAPVPLPAGEYGVAVNLPLYGVSPAESTATARVIVEKVEKNDGSAPPPFEPAR